MRNGTKKWAIPVAMCAMMVGIASPAAGQPTTRVDDGTGQQDTTDVQEIIDEAFAGDTSALEEALASGDAAMVQAALAERLASEPGSPISGIGEDHQAPTSPSFQTPQLPQLPPQANASTYGTPNLCNGHYNCVCQGYNGVSMNWYNQEILACHGYMKHYIPGNQVASYIPDLLPRGTTISAACGGAIVGTAATIVLAPSGTGIGWGIYGIGVLAGGASMSISCG